MFHPYSIHGGTATVDPQIAGMNGQSRIPEMFGQAYQQIAGSIPFAGGPVTGLPIGAPGYGYAPFIAGPTTPYGYPTSCSIPQQFNPYIANGINPYIWGAATNPYVNTIPNTPFVNTLPTLPYVNTIPTSPFVNTIPVNPFINPIPASPIAGWNTVPMNPFTNTVNPLIPTPMVNPAIPTAFGNVATQQISLVPTPFGWVYSTIPTVNPYLNNPVAWGNYPFRSPNFQTPFQATIGSIPCGIPTSITGIPTIDSIINGWNSPFNSPATALNTLASCCTPVAGINNPLASPYVNWPTSYPGAVNPFINPWNIARSSMIHNPFINGLNPVTSSLGIPYSNIIAQHALQTMNPFVNPVAANLGLQAACLSNPFLAGNPIIPSLVGANSPLAFSPFNGITTPTINPLNGTTNPFFSPTNIGYGIPGYPGVMPTTVGMTGPLTAPSTGSVCCN